MTMKYLKTTLCLMVLTAVLCTWNPICGQTKLYNQYKHRTDMVVACAMNFPITDSLKTDITLFVPKTKEDLWPMVQEFGLGLDKDTVYNRFEKEEKYTLYFYNVPKDNIKKSFGPITSDKDYKNIAKLVYSYNMGMIMILHDIDTKERERQIISFLIEATTDSDILPQMKK